jgi:hypothetical protein
MKQAKNKTTFTINGQEAKAIDIIRLKKDIKQGKNKLKYYGKKENILEGVQIDLVTAC